jgi:flagellar basal-body rod protein FlgG
VVMRSLSVGGTGMMAQQLNVEVIANNLANMTTTGYQRRRPEFQDLLYQSQRRVGSSSSTEGTVVPAGVQLGLGVKTAAVYRIPEQGDLVNTENSLDVAIQGEGYFIVELPDGETAYTRSGNFQLSADGVMVTSDGYTVGPGITVPENTIEIAINSEGTVTAKVDGQTDLVDLGQLELASFVNQAGLEAIGSNLLMETEASGAAFVGTPSSDGLGSTLQGYLESSNVNPVQEITALIAAQRAYDLNSKVISASDEMLATVTQMS